MRYSFPNFSTAIIPPTCALIASIGVDDGADAGGGGGGGDAKAGDDASAADDAPITAKQFNAYRKEAEQKVKRLNDELARRRHQTKPPAKKVPAVDIEIDDEPGAGREDNKFVTREELEAQRNYDRELGRIEAAGYDAEALASLEETASSLDVKSRAAFIKGVREGFERGQKAKPKDDDDTATGDREVGAEHNNNNKARKPARGGEPPARRKASQGPSTWTEYYDVSNQAATGDKDAIKQIDEWNKMIGDDLLDIESLRQKELEARVKAARLARAGRR